jgi:hypothetical protein
MEEKMNKVRTFIAAFLMISCVALYADVSVVKLADGNAEVTFFYGNPKAQEVTIRGDFTNWEADEIPMVKVEKGWEYKTVVPMDTVMKYKFFSDGFWTPDLKAPESVDDGFGGKNGLVEVASLAVDPTSNAPAAPVVASAGRLTFGTWSIIEARGSFDKDMELQSAGLGVRSVAKLAGSGIKNMPMYLEIDLADVSSFNNFYQKNALTWEDGLKNFGVDMLTNPIAYLNNGSTKVGHVKVGFDSEWVNATFGYKNAKMSPNTIANWTTVTDNWDAGYSEKGGFLQLDLGSALQQIGDLTVKARLTPNKTADRAGNRYGMLAAASVQYGVHNIGVQYNGAYGTTYDKIFDEILESDFIVGYAGSFGPFAVKANAVMNVYGSILNADGTKSPYVPASSDAGSVSDDVNFLENLAFNVNGTYTAGMVSVTAGYRARGTQANLMYVKDKVADNLGGRNTQKGWVDTTVTMDSVVAGLEASAELQLLKAANAKNYVNPFTDEKNIKLFAKPTVKVALSDTMSIDGYGKVTYNTKDETARGSAKSNVLFEEAGLKFAMDLDGLVKNTTVMYGFDNGDASYLFNTLVATATLSNDINLELILGLRTANKDVAAPATPFGFGVGVNKKINTLAKPTAYANFVYGLDPYKDFGDGRETLKMDGYTLDKGVSAYATNANLSLGLHWDL